MAISLLDNRFSVLPIRPGSKQPAVKWETFQRLAMPRNDAERMFSNGCNIGLVCGAVSGNLECLDFDRPDLLPCFKDTLESVNSDLLKRLTVWQETPSSGYHLWYRCSEAVAGNTKLAMSKRYHDNDGKTRQDTWLETRGEGGYALVAPSTVGGKAYRLHGELTDIPILTPTERELLHAVARSFDESGPQETKDRHQRQVGDRPGDRYERETDWQSLMTGYGWTFTRMVGDRQHWTRPGKTDGSTSATLNDQGLFVFSTSTPLPNMKPLSKFAVYTYYEHSGDFTVAAQELVRRYGMERQVEHTACTATTSKVITPLDVLNSIDIQRPPKEFIADGYIPCGCVGLLTGTGSVGKSFLSLLLAAAVASGKAIEPFKPAQPRRVMIVNVEDGDDDLARRIYSIGQEYFFTAEERDLLQQNLVILPGRGQIGPLMKKENAVPVETDNAEWLRSQVEQYDPSLVILDTKARLYGLEENSTDDGSQWVALLEQMLVGRPWLTFLIVSHTAKNNVQSEDQHADRGASSVADNSRFVMVATKPKEDDMRNLNGPDPRIFVKLSHAKSSYSAPAPPVFFRKNPFGVPVFEEVRDGRFDAMSNALDRLILILKEDYPDGLNKRALERGDEDPAKKIKNEVLGTSGLKKGDWLAVIDLGIESTRLEEVEDSESSANRKPILVKARYHN
jgi:hypothetical protein